MKLFTAATMQEAMSQVKSELGREAVILHTRRSKKGGIFGFLGKEVVEVMAGLEPKAPAPVSVPEQRPAGVLRTSGEGDTKVTALQLELANMRKTLEQVVQKMPTEKEQTSPLLEILIKNDVDRQIAENLIKGLPEYKDFNHQLATDMLEERIANYFQRVAGISVPQRGTKTVALIGPTGVGKTTTLAKLAANFVIKEGCKVALVTADTYRISAVEQLKTYADIIGVPIEVVYSPDELKAALYRHQDKQLVLVDTAGRSPSNQYQLAELQALLEVDPYIETHLVMSTTTKYRDALEIVDKFSICSPQKFLFTKVDEASNLGTIFNLLYQFPAILSYITTGQNVPDDISIVNPNELAKLMLRD